MGLYDFGEYLFGTIIVINIMLMAFGSLPTNDFLQANDHLDPGLRTVGVVNVNQLDQNSSLNGTPYAGATQTGVEERSNLFLNLGFADLPKVAGFITMALFGFAVAISWMGLHPLVNWVLIAPLSVFMLFFGVFFIFRLIGSLRGGGSV